MMKFIVNNRTHTLLMTNENDEAEYSDVEILT